MQKNSGRNSRRKSLTLISIPGIEVEKELYTEIDFSEWNFLMHLNLMLYITVNRMNQINTNLYGVVPFWFFCTITL